MQSRFCKGDTMKRIVFTLACLPLGVGLALAGPRCSVPMADWQPREVLQEKLRAEGWTITRIKTDDGCYKVYATDSDGRRLKAKFNPATLEMLRRESDD